MVPSSYPSLATSERHFANDSAFYINTSTPQPPISVEANNTNSPLTHDASSSSPIIYNALGDGSTAEKEGAQLVVPLVAGQGSDIPPSASKKPLHTFSDVGIKPTESRQEDQSCAMGSNKDDHNTGVFPSERRGRIAGGSGAIATLMASRSQGATTTLSTALPATTGLNTQIQSVAQDEEMIQMHNGDGARSEEKIGSQEVPLSRTRIIATIPAHVDSIKPEVSALQPAHLLAPTPLHSHDDHISAASPYYDRFEGEAEKEKEEKEESVEHGEGEVTAEDPMEGSEAHMGDEGDTSGQDSSVTSAVSLQSPLK